jgi:hypothetical protein
VVKREIDLAQLVATQAGKGYPAKDCGVAGAHTLSSPHILEAIRFQKFQETANPLRTGITVPADALRWQGEMLAEFLGGGLCQ